MPAREALVRLAEMRRTRATVFAEGTELRRFAGQDWFVSAALRAWGQAPHEKLFPFVAQVTGARIGELVSLSVASADAAGSAGKWGIWSGIVQESKIDRDRRVTTLYAKGLDTYVLRIDERVHLATGKGENRVKTPEVDIRGVAGEKLEPNGRMFVVEVKEIQAALTELRPFIAVGKIGATTNEGRPVLEAYVVVSRRPRGGSEMD